MITFSEPNDLAITLREIELLEELASPCQTLRLFLHPTLGRVLVIDDELQHVEAWQALYHEPLVHVPAAFLPTLRDVLILGGGSLFAASEALKYPTVRSCTLVDHDPEVLRLMARHYEHARAVLDDGRFTFVQADVVDFLARGGPTFDLVVNDCLDSLQPTGTDKLSFTDALDRRMAPDGICSDLIYRHLWAGHLAQTKRSLASRSVALSLVAVPEYPGTLHLLTMWSRRALDQAMRRPVNEVQQGWCDADTVPRLVFYDPRFLGFHLYLPPYVRAAWDEQPVNR
jgi:spermidine synthase